MHSGIEKTVALEDRVSIEALLTEFYWRLDHPDAGPVAELFVERGTLVTPRFSATGREQISQWFNNRALQAARITRHSWMNLRLSAAAGGRVLVESHVLTAATPSTTTGQPVEIMFGDTSDLVVNDAGGGWLFESRRLDMALQGRLVGVDGER